MLPLDNRRMFSCLVIIACSEEGEEGIVVKVLGKMSEEKDDGRGGVYVWKTGTVMKAFASVPIFFLSFFEKSFFSSYVIIQK